MVGCLPDLMRGRVGKSDSVRLGFNNIIIYNYNIIYNYI